MKIFKYVLEVTDKQTLEMPVLSRIIGCQAQRGNITLWAMVDPNSAVEKRSFEIYGTGQDVEMDKRFYIGSVIMGGLDQFVWHVFEVTKP